MNTGCKQAKKTQAYNKVFTSVVAQHKVIPKVGRWQARLLEFSQVKQNHVSRLGSCQCCTQKLKYRIAMNLAFLGIFWTYTEKYFLPH